MSAGSITLWRYVLPSVRHEGWAIVVLGSDGYFSAVSDYGNYAYLWTHHGYDDFRKFFLRVQPDYMVSKIAPRTEYSGEHTYRAIVETIIRRRREDRDRFSREEARREYELLRAAGVRDGSILEFAEWMKETDLRDGDAYELAVYRHGSDAIAFCERIIPRLREILRAELYPKEIVHA